MINQSDFSEMKLSIIGTRGIPAKYGGFETFAEEMSALLAAEGLDVTVQCDKDSYGESTFRGTKLWFAPVTKTKHTLRYYYEGFKWSIKNCDVILVASSAASFFYPLNILRRKVIITNPDGLEHRRKKWPFMKKLYLKVSEMLAMRMSDYILADSENIKRYLDNKYPFAAKKTRVIEYGAFLNTEPDLNVLKKYQLVSGKYYLIVCRLEPENNLDMILEGYQKAMTACSLVIIGNILNTEYVKHLVNNYGSEKIRFFGGIYDKKELNALRYSCRAYIHGHSVGGTNPSLLEAMASRNIIIAHDNVFNREVTDDSQLYFQTPEQCTNRIIEVEHMSSDEISKYREHAYRMIIFRYNWEAILSKYLDLLREISLNRKK